MRILLALICAIAFIPTAIAAEPDTYSVGVARADITPNYPIRLNGFGFRRTESEGVTQKIWAKALAIGTDEDGPAVLIAVDNLGISTAIREEIAARLAKQMKLEPKR